MNLHLAEQSILIARPISGTMSMLPRAMRTANGHSGRKPVETLDHRRPAFLDRLETDRNAAFEEFFRYAWRLLSACPPAPLLRLSTERREDIIADVILHCVRDEFRVLRTYREGSFPGWLLMIARNRAVDEIRRDSRRREVPLPPDEPGESPVASIPSREPSASARSEWSECLALVRDCLARMSKKCQILLWGTAQGLRPRELERFLGISPGSNKKTSDDLRYCRRRLKDLLAAEGFEWDGVGLATVRHKGG